MKRTLGFAGRFSAGVILFFYILVISTSCDKDSGKSTVVPTPGPNEVWIQNMSFNPGSLTIDQGMSIKWINKDAVSHTVTSDNGLFDSGTINKNGTYTHAFDSVGIFSYHSNTHPNMKATIEVDVPSTPTDN